MAPKTTRAKGAKSKKAARATSEHYQKALETLERVMKSMHKGDHGKAKEYLVKLRDGYPEETELMDRVKSYLIVCERHLSPQKRLKDAEEMVNVGVISLNDGDAAQAIKFLSKALELEPKNAHAQYCIAAAHAISGDASSTAKHLKQAISTDPSTRVHAIADEDFASVRNSAEVSALLAEA